ncbi:hypothetical protein RND71_025781 [Anisodus tanguticus]|uniref:Nop domain-containing protein n=1 Tax=Anisodus tanguticus TaxID=243964 RepID=A0AAE1V372_9SOLA|nr:hypothetical protein RND71_025781 [Anisodus tanguticus]
MLVLFEMPAGFALSKYWDLSKEFATSDSARKVVKLKAFSMFENTTEALSAATLLIDSKPSKGLRKFLKAHCEGETLGVTDSKFGNAIKEKLVDTMIVQAIGLLDDLDKELNTYTMRVREWHGWHFPELAKIVQDNILYAKAVKLMGDRVDAAKLDFSEILPEEVEAELKEAAMISMGTEVSDLDLENIKDLCSQVLPFSEYWAQLYDYLKSRMNTIAPNLTALVGELVGTPLIAHGGSLLNLAKQPGSTVQILGAEKALFRALKPKHATPKYGLLYHASLISQAALKHKGKIARSLASKASLAIRYDALGDGQDNTIGLENRVKVYNPSADSVLGHTENEEKKMSIDETPSQTEESEKKKKKKKKSAEAADGTEENVEVEKS